MNPDQRAALERLLEYVGRGFCAVQADCKVLREFLAASADSVKHIDGILQVGVSQRMPDGGSQLLFTAERKLPEMLRITYVAPDSSPARMSDDASGARILITTTPQDAPKKNTAKRPTPKPRKR